MPCDECGRDERGDLMEICLACGEQFCEECYDEHECDSDG